MNAITSQKPMPIKTIKVQASRTTVAIPLHLQTSMPGPREVRTGPPRAQGLLDWNSLPLRNSFDPGPTLPALNPAAHSFDEFFQVAKTDKVISPEVVFTAITDPPNKPVTWSGDLGYQQAVAGNAIRIRFSTPGQKVVTASCDGKAASASVRVFRLEIIEPAYKTEFFISAVPAMPRIVARAAIVGIDPDPTATTTLEWTARIRFQKTFGRGKHSWQRSINPPDLTQRVQGGRFIPAFPRIRGGELTLIAKATYAGQPCEARTVGLTIQGTNPARTDIQTAIADPSLVLEVQQAIQRVACHESEQRQFQALANGGTGWPLWSRDNKGGVGILQITNPAPSDDAVWNWQENIAAGIKLFKEKIAIARGFPKDVRSSPGFQAALARYNAARKEQGLPPLTIRVPEFDAHQLALDTLRAFNGFGGRRQFDLWCHEFRLAMDFVPGRIVLDASKMSADAAIQQFEAQSTTGPRILRVININGTIKTGDAVWERVPIEDRPTSTGDPDYVNNVLSKDPGCGG